MRIATIAFCAGLAAAGAALARPPVAYAPAAAAEARPLSPVQRLERRFLQISAANLRFQAEASRMAAARTNNPAVKDLANTLLARQDAAQPELLRLLHARGMALPLASNEHGKLLRQLSRLQGPTFDRLYVEEVVQRSVQVDVANYEKVAAQAQEPVLKAWIDRQLPTLRFHLAKAQRVMPPASLRGQRAV